MKKTLCDDDLLSFVYVCLSQIQLFLKSGIRVKNPTYATTIIKACACLHNFLIDEFADQTNYLPDAIFEEEDDENGAIEGDGRERFELMLQTFLVINGL